MAGRGVVVTLRTGAALSLGNFFCYGIGVYTRYAEKEREREKEVSGV